MGITFERSEQISGEAITVPCYAQLNLLAHAQLEELEIGSRCGGHGVCGGDQVRVIRGAEQLSPPTQAERHHLTQGQLASGWRLACQCYPSGDDQNVTLQYRADPV